MVPLLSYLKEIQEMSEKENFAPACEPVVTYLHAHFLANNDQDNLKFNGTND